MKIQTGVVRKDDGCFKMKDFQSISRLKLIFAYTTNWTDPGFRQCFKGRAGDDIVFRIAYGGVVDVAAS